MKCKQMLPGRGAGISRFIILEKCKYTSGKGRKCLYPYDPGPGRDIRLKHYYPGIFPTQAFLTVGALLGGPGPRRMWDKHGKSYLNKSHIFQSLGKYSLIVTLFHNIFLYKQFKIYGVISI